MNLRIDYKKLKHAGFDGGGSEILHYKGEPFTGFLVEYFSTGQLLAEDEYQDGYIEGWHREYYENGQLKQEYQLHHVVDHLRHRIGSFCAAA